jgi:glycine dehydrogenase subunit 1
MSLLGEAGLRRLALLNHQQARKVKAAVEAIPGVEVLTPRFFNEIAVRLPTAAEPLVDALAAKGVIAGVPVSRLDPNAGLDDVLLLAATETTHDDDIAALKGALTEAFA